MPSDKLKKAIAERLAKEEAEQRSAPTSSVHVPVNTSVDHGDLIPNLDPSLPADAPATAEQDAETLLDQIIDSMPILDAYRIFCGKMQPTVLAGQVESIMISCPNKSHPDQDPSAWVNTVKNQWHCEGDKCGRDGGTVIDLVGAVMGVQKASRRGQSFHDIRREIARGIGWRTVTSSSGRKHLVPPAALQRPTVQPKSQSVQSRPASTGEPFGVGQLRPGSIFGNAARNRKAKPTGRGTVPPVSGGLPPEDGAAGRGGQEDDTTDQLDQPAGPASDGAVVSESVSGLVSDAGLAVQQSDQESPGKAAPERSTNTALQASSGAQSTGGRGLHTSNAVTGAAVAASSVAQPELLANSPAPGKLLQFIQPAAETEPEEEAELDRPVFPWQHVFKEGTFAYEYMKACTVDDCCEEYHAANALIALGLAGGKRIALKDQPKVLGNLFVCLVGRSGSNKSRSTNHLLRLLEEHLPFEEMDDQPIGVDVIEPTSSGQALVGAFKKPAYNAQGKQTDVDGGNKKGLLKWNELSELVAITSMKANTLKPKLLDIYDGREIGDRSVGRGKQTTTNSFGSLSCTSQDDSLKNLLTRADQDAGFVNRFAFFSGPYKTQHSFAEFDIDLDVAGELLSETAVWAQDKGIVLRDPRAEKVWGTFFHNTLQPIQTDNQSTGILQRVDLLMKKMMLLLCVNEHSTVLTVDIVEKVILLWPYFRDCYRMVERSLITNEWIEREDYISGHVKKAKDGITAAEIWRKVRTTKIAQEMGQKGVNSVLKTLVESGRIEIQETKGGRVGRPTEKYFYVA